MNVAFAAAADGARDEDAIAPDDRARVAEPGNRRAPQDVLAGLAVPASGSCCPSATPDASRPAERRPAARAAAAARQRRQRAPAVRGHDARVRDRFGFARPAARRCGRGSCRRGMHASLTRPRLRPAALHADSDSVPCGCTLFASPVSSRSRICDPSAFHLPANVGQPSPFSENVPSAAKTAP